MTAVLDDVRPLTEDELADLVSGEDDAARTAAVAELDRRDEAARKYAAGHGRRRMADTAWAEAAQAQYLQAEEHCRGHLLSRKGKAAGVTEWSLWTGPEHVARAHASEELNALWDDQGRVTVQHWRDAMAADRREERETAAREAAPKGTETRDMGLGYMAVRAGVRAAQNAQRHPGGQGMTHADLEAHPAAGPRLKAMRAQRQLAAQAVQGMADQAHAQEARKAHQAVAVPAQAAPVRRQRDHVDGATVLGYVNAWLKHYARWPSESAADLATLWAAGALVRDKDRVMVWDAFPRLMFLSSEPGSGKSQALELESLLCGSAYGPLAEPSQAAVAHMLGSEHEPTFLDESDLLFGSGQRKAGLRAVLNLGYKRKGCVPHKRGEKIVRLEVGGVPVAFAGLDVVKTATSGALDALLQRCVIVRMRKSADRVPSIGPKAEQEGAMLHAALTAWAQQERDTLEQAEVELPDWLTGRAAEIWAPLFVLAGTAAASHVPADEHDDGGNWPERVMIAAEDLALAPELAGEETGDLMAGLAGMAEGWG